MKRSISIILIALLCLSMLPMSAVAANPVRITVDGVEVVFPDAKPYVNSDNRTMVPLRAVAEAMGLEVYWDNDEQAARFIQRWSREEALDAWEKGDGEDGDNFYPASLQYVFYVGKNYYFHDMSSNYSFEDGELAEYFGGSDERFEMDTVTVLKDGRTYAPIRYLAEAFGWDVAWDGATSTVKIMTAQPYTSGGYYTFKPVDIFLSSKKGLISAKIISVSIQKDYEGIVEIDFTEHTDEQAQKIIDQGFEGYLAGVTTNYFVEEGSYYQIWFTALVVKENGAEIKRTYYREYGEFDYGE